ncbi:unnamed protein product [Dibothriocephalus latus]|uniref:Uncharacterized protein n=1 Tax=Dibothriocephalus latus TaxID=60516 RepID=A0A3P7LR27_DIBLA|nr:unnamed protein product [Dibothriocephalus latus]
MRVAGHFYGNFRIPPDLRSLWAYMSRVYAVPAFKVSCPSDRDILLHHFERVTFPTPVDRTATQRRILALEENQHTFSIPAAFPNSPRSHTEVRTAGQSAATTKVFDKAMVQDLSKKQVTFGLMP